MMDWILRNSCSSFRSLRSINYKNYFTLSADLLYKKTYKKNWNKSSMDTLAVRWNKFNVYAFNEIIINFFFLIWKFGDSENKKKTSNFSAELFLTNNYQHTFTYSWHFADGTNSNFFELGTLVGKGGDASYHVNLSSWYDSITHPTNEPEIKSSQKKFSKKTSQIPIHPFLTVALPFHVFLCNTEKKINLNF